jgi:hypothetical protein
VVDVDDEDGDDVLAKAAHKKGPVMQAGGTIFSLESARVSPVVLCVCVDG